DGPAAMGFDDLAQLTQAGADPAGRRRVTKLPVQTGAAADVHEHHRADKKPAGARAHLDRLRNALNFSIDRRSRPSQLRLRYRSLVWRPSAQTWAKRRCHAPTLARSAGHGVMNHARKVGHLADFASSAAVLGRR